jgi:acyl-CoA dehydrogenase
MDAHLRPLALFDSRHLDVLQEACNWIAAEPGIDEVEIEDCYALTAQFVRSAGKVGLLRHFVPKPASSEHPFDVRSICLVREALAYHCALADAAIVTQGLGAVPLWRFGSDEQRQRYLPGLASGEIIPSLALSEPHGASDVAGIRTTATRDGDSFVLNGAKTWTSNAGLADIYIVIARTGEAPGSKGLSAFVVHADTPGLEVGEKIVITEPHPMASVTFNECRVPASQMLGAPGNGFRTAMSTLDVFRTTVGAFAVGLARRAFDETVNRVRTRELFGQKMSEMPAIQMKIAEMYTDLTTAALTVYQLADVKDKAGAQRISLEPAVAKLYASEASFRVVDNAVQLFGGMGVTRGCIIERLFREVRAARIYEGASEIQKLVIARQVLA